jgi:L-ectoine synthase
MITRRLQDVEGTNREVDSQNWTSRRLLLREDQMGFSLHDTIIRAGTSTEIHYQNHLEAVYCIEGKGVVHILETDRRYDIEAGTLYALDEHDRHLLIAETQMRMVCVFNPPVVGPEVHDDNGVYPAFIESSKG